ncbi:MAG: ATP-binding protein [Pseudomonadota bacterium]|nr:ATP-binding protein [Pseudomonadota bacterium]
MNQPDTEDKLLREVAMRNANSILLARLRVEQELREAKEALEHKTAELAKSLSIMHATLEATKDGILVTSEDGTVTGHNNGYVSMWQIPAELMAEKHHPKLLRYISRNFARPEEFLAAVERIYASAPEETLDVLELQDGRVFERFSRLQAIGGRHLGRVWSFRDITEQVRTERALREETRVLEILNRTGTTLTANLDLETLVQAVTDAATELSGARFGAFFYTMKSADGGAFMLYTLSGAPREAFERFGHPRATALFGPTFEGAGTIRIDDVLTDARYGKSAPYFGMPAGHLPVRSYLSVPVISRSGEVLGGLFFGHPEAGVFTERAERIVLGVAAQAAIAIDNASLFDTARAAAAEREKLLQSERMARAEAERMSEMKDEFLATLSHELRTPLSSILGWSYVLRRGVQDPEELQRGVEAIERNARVQTQLIEDLLDMSRINSGKLRLDVQPVQPISFVEAALETVRPAADAKGIRIDSALDPKAGPIAGDPGRLQQVVWNLLSNAIKFTPKEGKVQVVLERVDSHIEIAIADTGIGIDPDFLPHVFERFRQADGSSTRQHGGLGLGLAIVKHLVELHGGTVDVYSAGDGRGATFRVLLPLLVVHRSTFPAPREHPAAARPGMAEFARVDLSGVKVLVVDDEPDARELIRRVLSDCGAEVNVAASGDDALALIPQQRPHVLVSDIGMPGMDGYDLLRKVRMLGIANGGKVPAIALTAFARSEDRTRALHAGFLVHVSKPVEPAELVATVASVAGRSSG